MAPIAPSIRSRPQCQCHVCGGPGDIAYSGLRDRLFGVPGEWNLRRCRDPRCGLLWLDPMPIEGDLPRLYETYYTHSEARHPHLTAPFREALKKAYWRAKFGYAVSGPIRAMAASALLLVLPGVRAQLALQVFNLPAVPGGRLLEVGCGNGATLLRLSDLGWQAEGVDFDDKAVDVARSRGLTVRQGDLPQQAYPPDSFDAVVMSHMIEHVPDPRALLMECHRILRPGGQLVCITPNAESWCHRLYKGDWRGLEPPRHLHIFTLAALRRLECDLDWSETTIGVSTAGSHGTFLASRLLKARGWYRLGTRPSAIDAFAGRIFQAMADGRRLFDRETGEEIVLQVRK